MLKKIIVPVIAAAAFALVAPATADASPLNPVAGKSANVFGPRIRIGGRITVPIGGRRHVRHVRSGGYYQTVYETRIERVWHPGELIGYDSHGHAIYSRGHFDNVQHRVPVRVWVPYTTVRRVHHRRPVGHISIGGSWRIR